MTDILAALRQINVERQVQATVVSFQQNVEDIDSNFLEVRTAINALCERVVALESQTSGSPVLTNFHITAPARVDVGSDISENDYNATYDILASTLVANARLIGFQSVPSGGAVTVLVADAVRAEGANTQSWTFPIGADFSADGNAYTIRLELYTAGQTPGVDTPVQQAEQRVFAQAAPRADMLYWGLLGQDNTPQNVDVTTLLSQTRLDGDVTLPTFTDNQYIVFAYPETSPAVTSLQFNGGFSQLGGFVLTPGAITVNSVSYSTLISANLLIGQSSGVDIFSGATATITR